MSNGSNNLPKLKIQNIQRKKSIENQLERDISGIVGKNKVFSKSKGSTEVNEQVASRLRSFLDERLSNEKSDDYDGSQYYDQDFHRDNNDYEDDYYEDDYNDEDYENYEYYKDIKNNQYRENRENPNSYLPFTYEELQPEVPNGDDLEEMILDAVMPSVAQWLDLNIDRIVHKVVKESLQNRGMPEGEYSRYPNNYSARYKQDIDITDRDFLNKESLKEERLRFSDSVSSIQKDTSLRKNTYRDKEISTDTEKTSVSKKRVFNSNRSFPKRSAVDKKTLSSPRNLRSVTEKKGNSRITNNKVTTNNRSR